MVYISPFSLWQNCQERLCTLQASRQELVCFSMSPISSCRNLPLTFLWLLSPWIHWKDYHRGCPWSPGNQSPIQSLYLTEHLRQLALCLLLYLCLLPLLHQVLDFPPDFSPWMSHWRINNSWNLKQTLSILRSTTCFFLHGDRCILWPKGGGYMHTHGANTVPGAVGDVVTSEWGLL